jgi:hypothetical protein
MEMSRFRKGLKLFVFCGAAAYCQQSLTNQAMVVPALKTLEVDLVEMGETVPAEHHFVFHLGDSLRDRYLELNVDRSVCKGKVVLNHAAIEAGDITTMVRFDRGNQVSVAGCLERTPKPIEVRALPKVHVAKAVARASAKGWEIEVTVRNTLSNSASCSVTVGGQQEDFLIGPETSQTRSFFARLDNWKGSSIPVELYKFEEAVEGAYRHLYRVELPQRAP